MGAFAASAAAVAANAAAEGFNGMAVIAALSSNQNGDCAVKAPGDDAEAAATVAAADAECITLKNSGG